VPTPISAVERLRRERQERAIEDLLYTYPGLIDPSLAHPKRQVALSRDSRADLLFEIGRQVVLVEIKRDVIRPATVAQIQRYAKCLKKPMPRISGYLVAPEITPAAEASLKKSPFPLKFKKLGVEVPTVIKVCRTCRNAYDARLAQCPSDGQTQTI